MAIAVEFLPVGDSDGDAIIVQYGTEESYWVTVVDGGYASIGEQVIEHIEKNYGSGITIHDMVVSHADNDHAAGLIPIFKHFNVGALWMNRPIRSSSNFTATGRCKAGSITSAPRTSIS
jgi:beta-lactamase superfamily II metal-dependent hydrolase